MISHLGRQSSFSKHICLKTCKTRETKFESGKLVTSVIKWIDRWANGRTNVAGQMSV